MRDFLDYHENLERRVAAIKMNAHGIPGARSGYGRNEQWSKVTVHSGATLTAGKLEKCCRSDMVYFRTVGGMLGCVKDGVIAELGLYYKPSREVYVVMNGLPFVATPTGRIIGLKTTAPRVISGYYFIG